MTRGTIRFYRVNEEYGAFSNFASFPVQIFGRTWRTAEHAFQAQKFAGTPRELEIHGALTPREAAALGRDRSVPLRSDWAAVKVDLMREIVHAKFAQHPDLARILRDTGDALLVEHTHRDAFWGDGGDGRGQNMLGKILMEVRARLMEGG